MGRRGNFEHQWTRQEDRELADIFQLLSDERLGVHFGVPTSQITKRRSELGLRRKSIESQKKEERCLFIEDNYRTMSVENMAFELGVPISTVLYLGREIGIHLGKARQKATAEYRKSYIQQYYGHKPLKRIAEDLQMPANRVAELSSKMGMKRALNELIIKTYLATRLSYAALAQKLDLLPHYVKVQIDKYKRERDENNV